MKLSITTLWIVAAGMFAITGCKQETATTVATDAATESHDDVDGEHEGEHNGDAHSLAGHGHGAGPHDGVIADWGGGKYHVEFTVDHDKKQATAYVLGADEKTATPIDAETIDLAITDPQMLVTLKAVPQDSDPAGKSSRYVGTDENLGVVQEYAGTMTGVVDGTPYSGDFVEE